MSVSARCEWAVVGATFAVVLLVAVFWLHVDRQPPEWDDANHLERVVTCADDLAAHDVRAIIERSSFYPPLVPCTAALVYRFFPSDTAAAQSVVLVFLGIGMAAIYLLGRRLGGGAAGMAAAVLFATAPFVVASSLTFGLDLPLASMVTVALWTLVETEGFARGGWAIAAGIVCGLGLVTKPPFGAYVLPAAVFAIARVRSRRSLGHALVAGAITVAIALPWYGPRLAGLPSQIDARSFRQAAESGHPDVLSWTGLTFYPRFLVEQFGVLAVLLFVVGLVIALRRRQGFLLVSLLVPFVLFELLRNKNLRYTLPLLPLVAIVAALTVGALRGRARSMLVAAVAVAGVLQLGGTAFGVPPIRDLPGLDVPWAVTSAPVRQDWKQREILALIERHAGGRPVMVSVVPNAGPFSVSNFRYYALRDGLPFRFSRAWDEAPVGIDYMILKSGDIGPGWTAARPRRIAARFATDRDLDRVFPSIGTFPLPDGSVATVRERAVPAVDGIAPAALAEAVQTALRHALDDYARDVEGLRVAMSYDATILTGHIRRLDVTAAAATVGELRRRHASPLRLHDLQLTVDDLLVNPFSARDGRFDVLDAGQVAIEHAVLTQADLAAFLARDRDFSRASIDLRDGAMAIAIHGPGPRVAAHVRFVTPADRPFALHADHVRVGGVPIPSLLVNWVVRNYDPSPRIADRLPVSVRLGRVTIVPGQIRITSPSDEEKGR